MTGSAFDICHVYIQNFVKVNIVRQPQKRTREIRCLCARARVGIICNRTVDIYRVILSVTNQLQLQNDDKNNLHSDSKNTQINRVKLHTIKCFEEC